VGYDLYSILFVVSACRQGFPDTLRRATVCHTLVRTWIVATLRRAKVFKVAPVLMIAIADTTRQADYQR